MNSQGADSPPHSVVLHRSQVSYTRRNHTASCYSHPGKTFPTLFLAALKVPDFSFSIALNHDIQKNWFILLESWQLGQSQASCVLSPLCPSLSPDYATGAFWQLGTLFPTCVVLNLLFLKASSTPALVCPFSLWCSLFLSASALEGPQNFCFCLSRVPRSPGN